MKLSLFITVAACLVSNDSSPAESAPPNILFVIADDWGAHAGVYGTPWVKTPAFDRVAREGVLFRNAYTPTAKCAPSRAALLTGRNPWQLEEAGNHMAYFPAKFKTWPEVLADNGWTCGITGKGWGPGIANDADGKPRQMVGVPFEKRKAPPPTSGMLNNDYAANFVDFLDAAPADKPWMFWCGMLEPHRSYEFRSGVTKGNKQLSDVDRVPAYWPDDETVRHDILDYAFEVEHVDRHLGRMLDELAKRDLLDKTLVVVTSDHGMPFPRVKGYAYRDSNHVPLAFRWPELVLKPGRVVDDPVSFIDIAPSILAIVGIQAEATGMQRITGNGFLFLTMDQAGGGAKPDSNYVLIGKERTDVGRPHDWGYPIRGIVTNEYLYLCNYKPSRWPAGNPETGYTDTDASPTKSLILDRGRSNRSDKFWQLCFGMRPSNELYDLTRDPDCVVNLVGDSAHAERMQALRKRMEAELREQGDPRMFGRGTVFDEYKPTSGAGFYDSYLRGEKPKAGWISPTDIEAKPLEP